MNDLEERLRAALDARAETYGTAPDAYAETVSRARGTRRRRLALVPVAAAVAAVTAVAVFLGAGGGSGAGIATGAVEEPGPYRRSITENPPVGEPVTVRDPAENRPVIMWFSGGTAPGGLRFCDLVQQASGGTSGGCSKVPPAGHEHENAWRLDPFHSRWPRRPVELGYGAARPAVTRVEAVTGDGARIPGTVHRPGGAPLAVWTVSFPADAGVTRFEFLDGDGRVVQRIRRDAPMSPPELAKPPAGPAADMPGGLTARFYTDPERTVLWWRGGDVVGMNLIEPGHLLTDLGGKETPVDLRLHDGLWYGVARPGTARVALILRDGTSAGAVAVADPWGSGVALFSGTYRRPDPYLEGFQVVGYDAVGAEIWHDTVPAVTPIRPEPAPGASGTPGTSGAPEASRPAGSPQPTPSRR
ncbi:hypothetical protein [Streptosporangium pseudovulgare]|uniref:Uncharacterized protein n=1 Tax=Streptosporangium pseudovulgare TaxID=35765 RepID=A0ABQ2QJ78_9ACTN|nr:hypothetical protein [Streptosporangium pseudovulgare]GGP83074.1 hypothetical protein GCM10010140_09940 [Streptosporangium pseudovulgare]